MAIKPSGVSYEQMKVDDIVVVSLDDGRVVRDFNPSSDTATHLVLYRAFTARWIVHTYFNGTICLRRGWISQRLVPHMPITSMVIIPCTRPLTDAGNQFRL